MKKSIPIWICPFLPRNLKIWKYLNSSLATNVFFFSNQKPLVSIFLFANHRANAAGTLKTAQRERRKNWKNVAKPKWFDLGSWSYPWWSQIPEINCTIVGPNTGTLIQSFRCHLFFYHNYILDTFRSATNYKKHNLHHMLTDPNLLGVYRRDLRRIYGSPLWHHLIVLYANDVWWCNDWPSTGQLPRAEKNKNDEIHKIKRSPEDNLKNLF